MIDKFLLYEKYLFVFLVIFFSLAFLIITFIPSIDIILIPIFVIGLFYIFFKVFLNKKS